MKDLPKTLDETYDRILLNIPEEYRQDAQVIFTLLAYCSRSISLGEVAEALAIDLEEASFDSKNRFPTPYNILKICSGLVTLSDHEPQRLELPWVGRSMASGDDSKEIRFAHSSVKEYLVSRRLSQKNSHIFQVDSDAGHSLITRLCIIYLLSTRGTLLPPSTDDTTRSLPFLEYSANEWPFHYKAIRRGENENTREMVRQLFWKENESSLRYSLAMMSEHTRLVDWGHVQEVQNLGPLYYASVFGLVDVCQDILAKGDDVNPQDRRSYSNALQAASANGNKAVVMLLIDNGAEVNTLGESTAVHCKQP